MIAYVDWGSTSYIYDTDNNPTCEECCHIVWTGYVSLICAWCGMAETSTGKHQIGSAGRRELLMHEYKICTDQDKIKIMALVLGGK